MLKLVSLYLVFFIKFIVELNLKLILVYNWSTGLIIGMKYAFSQ